MSLPISVVALGGGLVALRMVRGKLLANFARSLDTAKGLPYRLLGRRFELETKLDRIEVSEPTISGAFTTRPYLARLPVGKSQALELTRGFRRTRHLVWLKAKGPRTEVRLVPSPSDLLNLVSILALIGAIGVATQAHPVFWAGLGLYALVEVVTRLRPAESSIRKALVSRT